MSFCYLNGKIIPLEQAVIPITDIGLLRGYSVFDLLRTYNGKPFLLKEHLKRLQNSANVLGLEIPLNELEIEKIITDLLKKNTLVNAKIRILLTGGNSIHGISYDPEHPTFAILVEQLLSSPKNLYTKGGKLISKNYIRHEFTAKTTNYINAVSLAKERKKKGAVEVLYIHDSHILECSTSNFFLFKDNTLITPKDNILLGMTRNFVLKLASEDFTIEERAISVAELSRADEAFITSTTKEIMPVVQIDSHVIGDGTVGGNTRKMMEKFASAVRNR